MKVPFELRPVCSCGVKMKLVEHRGYYDEFLYWRCDSCKLDEEMNKRKYKADHLEKGSYA